MRKIILFVLLSLSAKAQDHWYISKVDSVFAMDSTTWKPVIFGGISGIEKWNDSTYLLVSDRQAPSPAEDKQYSYLYTLNHQNKIQLVQKFYDIKNLEAIRYQSSDKKFWFSFENDESTGIGTVDEQGKVSILKEYSMITSPYTSLNRGIEGLTIQNDLWYSFEAGLDSTMIIRWKDQNPEKEILYKYPLDRNACLSPNQSPGSSLGNGISEILYIPGEEEKLLVLERCFNGRMSPIQIYEADFSGEKVEKKRIFNWDKTTTFEGKPLKPDNMEGMTWKEERRSLLLISDDNHNTRVQRTLVVEIRH
ncbi:esterase-like activity of phytase family protein [Leadbetterella byssophila]|uniref:esterase-like activity of phytase family protein n=1 Tax=Leadbetterella byssophila TaxID=316068 RepID=UPI00399F6F27